MDWTTLMRPPFTMVGKRISAPRRTRPILMKSSVLMAPFSHPGTPERLLITSPRRRAQRT
jgi:hypothetical protein